MSKSKYGFCNNCRLHVWLDSHRCAPMWQVYSVDRKNMNDLYIVYGYDAEDAALELAADKFSDWDYPETMQLWARRPGDDE